MKGLDTRRFLCVCGDFQGFGGIHSQFMIPFSSSRHQRATLTSGNPFETQSNECCFCCIDCFPLIAFSICNDHKLGRRYFSPDFFTSCWIVQLGLLHSCGRWGFVCWLWVAGAVCANEDQQRDCQRPSRRNSFSHFLELCCSIRKWTALGTVWMERSPELLMRAGRKKAPNVCLCVYSFRSW